MAASRHKGNAARRSFPQHSGDRRQTAAVRLSSFPVLDSSTAIGRDPGNSYSTITITAVIGTETMAPAMPQRLAQTVRLMTMA